MFALLVWLLMLLLVMACVNVLMLLVYSNGPVLQLACFPWFPLHHCGRLDIVIIQLFVIRLAQRDKKGCRSAHGVFTRTLVLDMGI